MSNWKNLIKRGFAVFLSLTLCLSLMNVSAFAEETTDVGSDDAGYSETNDSSDSGSGADVSNEDEDDAGQSDEDGNDAGQSDEDGNDAGQSDEDENDADQSDEDKNDADQSNEDKNDADQSDEDKNDADQSNEDKNDAGQSDEDKNDADQSGEDKNDADQSGEETKDPAEGEGDAQNPAEGEGDAQNPAEGEGDAQNPAEGEGDAQNPTEGEGDAQLPEGILPGEEDLYQRNEDGSFVLDENGKPVLKPVEPELPPVVEETPDALSSFLSKVEAIGSGELDMDQILAAIDDCLSSYEQLSEEEKAALADAYAALLAYKGELLGELPPEIMPLDGFVARVGEEDDENAQYFETLQEAIREAGDRNVYLLQDVTESVLLPASGAVLDLGGHTLTGDGRAAVNIMGLRAAGDITIRNGAIVGAEGYRAVVASNANLTLERVTMNPSGSLVNEGLQSSSFGGGCVYMDKGTLTVNDCTFSGDAGTYKESASYMGAGKFVEKTAYGSHIFAGASVTAVDISNSTFSNSESAFGAVYAACANVTVAGSTFTSNANGLQLDNKNGVFEVSGSTFTGGTKAINASGGTKMTLNIANSTFSGFTGGPVVNANGSTNITGGSFSGNNVDSNGVVQLGGGSLVMDGTSLTGNTSGGAVKTYSKADVTMRNVTATGNKGTTSMNSGGSVLNANSISGKTVILENVTATGNEQTKEHGGAFYLGGSSNDVNTVIEITNCTLTGNTAKNGGGAIYVNNKGTTTITNTLITGNTANGTGKYAGGGIQVGSTSGTVTLAGSTRVYGNETPNTTVKHLTVGATADIVLVSNNSKTDFTSEDAAQHATLVLDNETSFTGNDGNKYTLTKSDAAGLHYSSGSNSSKKFYWPIGYYTTVEEPVRVYLGAEEQHTGDKVVTAATLADAVAAAKDNGAQTVYVCGNVNVVTDDDVAALNSGITFVRCGDHTYAAKIPYTSTEIQVVKGYMFTIKCDAVLSSAHIDGNKVASDSALISVPGGHLTITGDTVIENGYNALGHGGGISLSQSGLTMTGGTITNNSAYSNGGGIYAYGGGAQNPMVFEGGTISKNSAGGNGGGGVYLGATSSYFGVSKNSDRTLFTENTTSQCGGAVFIETAGAKGVEHLMYHAKFTDNTSTRFMQYQDGGAVYIQSGTTVHMKNVYISGNRSTSDGAGAAGGYTALALCPTGDLAVYELDGLLAINNGPGANKLAQDMDIGWVYTSTGGSQSEGMQIYLSDKALGGGDVTYTTANGETIDISEYQFHKGPFSSLKSHASEEAIRWAESYAESYGVVVTGNRASQYGTGIMTNGSLIIGTETKSVKLVKEWTDGADKHVNDRVLVYLTRDGKIVDADTRADASVILSAANNWSYTWTNLDPNHEWSFMEAAIPGYTSILGEEVQNTEFGLISEQSFIRTLTNTPSTEESERLVISKTAYGLNPDASYKFTLKLDNVGGKVFSIQLPDGSVAPIYNNEITFYLKDGQSAVVEGLPVGYTYEVTEEENPAYKSFTFDSVTEDVNGSITSVMVVNIPMVSVKVQKLWSDTDDGGFRPASITVNLMNGEMVMDTAVVTPDEKGNWSHTFENLPEYDAEGNKIAYTVKEVGADAYNAEYELNTEGVWVITNTLRRGSLTINKAVVGGGTEAAEKVYTFTVTGADENTKDYKETVTITGAGTGVLLGLLPGAYTVTEEDASIGGYTWNVSGTGDVNVEANKDADDTTTVTVTNTYSEIKPEDGSLTITKVIRGGGSAAREKVYTFTVTGPDGFSRTVTITGEGSATLSPLTPGEYTVTEDRAGAVISGYTLSISGSGDSATVTAGGTANVTITNTYTTPGGGDPGDDDDDDPTPPPTPEIPEEDVPLTDIPEEETPLSEIPEVPEELEIPEEEVPLADVPETGDLGGGWMMAMLMGALGMLWMKLSGKKRSEEEEG